MSVPTQYGSGALTLYHSKTSVCSQKVRLILAELGLEWQSAEMNLANGEQFEQPYLAINQNGTVPTLLDGDLTRTDSNDAMLHICDAYDGSALKNNHVDEWMTLSQKMHSAVYVLTTLALKREKFLSLSKEKFAQRVAKVPNPEKAELLRDTVIAGVSGRAVQQAIRTCFDSFTKIEAALSKNDHLCGASVSLADFAVLPLIIRLGFLNLVPVGGESGFENIRNWQKRMMARPSYKTAIEHFHSAEVLETYREKGSELRPQIYASMEVG